MKYLWKNDKSLIDRKSYTLLNQYDTWMFNTSEIDLLDSLEYYTTMAKENINLDTRSYEVCYRIFLNFFHGHFL